MDKKTIGELTVAEFCEELRRCLKHDESLDRFVNKCAELHPTQNVISRQQLQRALKISDTTARKWVKGFLSPAVLMYGNWGQAMLDGDKVVELLQKHKTEYSCGIKKIKGV